MNEFALELSKQIEKLAIDEGKDTKECIRAGVILLRQQKNKKAQPAGLLEEIKAAKKEYKRLLTFTQFTTDELTQDECKVARDKLGHLIHIAKEEGIRGSIEFLAAE